MTASRINGNPHSSCLTGRDFDTWVQNSGLKVSDMVLPEIVWVDLETTGLDQGKDVPLELGIMLTDRVGNVIHGGVATWFIWGPNQKWNWSVKRASPFVKEMHDKSGLWNALEHQRGIADLGDTYDRMKPSRIAVDAVDWLRDRCGYDTKLPLSGSSPQFDRKFLNKFMPYLEDWFHYRTGVDVSGIRNTQKMVASGVTWAGDEPVKQEVHRPIPDMVDSIKLYQYQLRTFLKTDVATREMLDV